jgi:hypothetical protein
MSQRTGARALGDDCEREQGTCGVRGGVRKSRDRHGLRNLTLEKRLIILVSFQAHRLPPPHSLRPHRRLTPIRPAPSPLETLGTTFTPLSPAQHVGVSPGARTMRALPLTERAAARTSFRMFLRERLSPTGTRSSTSACSIPGVRAHGGADETPSINQLRQHGTQGGAPARHLRLRVRAMLPLLYVPELTYAVSSGRLPSSSAPSSP